MDRSNAEPGPVDRVPSTNRLLIIEDDEMVSEVIAMAARRLGYEVVTVNAIERCADLDRDPPSLVMLDLHLGDGGRRASGAPAMTPTAHTILMSGDDQATLEEAEAAYRARGWRTAGVLAKPFSLPALRKVLLEHRVDAPLSAARDV